MSVRSIAYLLFVTIGCYAMRSVTHTQRVNLHWEDGCFRVCIRAIRVALGMVKHVLKIKWHVGFNDTEPKLRRGLGHRR
jgi:hypothetical protein